MPIKYEITETLDGEILVKTDENEVISFIPIDESNSDYQAYLNKNEQQAALEAQKK